MTTETIISLIMALAPIFDVEPKVAIAVAAVESRFQPNAIGEAGEIGLFQIMPFVAKKRGFTPKQLHDPIINTYLGLELIKEAKDKCPHKHGIEYLVCYNYGAKNAKKIKHPAKFPYVRKVKKEMGRLLQTPHT